MEQLATELIAANEKHSITALNSRAHSEIGENLEQQICYEIYTQALTSRTKKISVKEVTEIYEEYRAKAPNQGRDCNVDPRTVWRLIARSKDPLGLSKCITFWPGTTEEEITTKIRKEIEIHLGKLPQKFLSQEDCQLPIEVRYLSLH
jgi:hypothetical protein